MTAGSSPGDLHTGPGQSGDGRKVADQASVDSGRDVESARRWNCGVGEDGIRGVSELELAKSDLERVLESLGDN